MIEVRSDRFRHELCTRLPLIQERQEIRRLRGPVGGSEPGPEPREAEDGSSTLASQVLLSGRSMQQYNRNQLAQMHVQRLLEERSLR